MKPQQLLLTIVFAFLATTICAQDTSKVVTINLEHLTKTWFLTNQSTSNQLLFFAATSAQHGWGQRIEFDKQGQFVDAYSAPCGNDQNIHHHQGKWMLNRETMVLTTTIPINYKETVHKIEKLTETQLVLTEFKY